jgi:hypothetical protein
LKATHVPEFGHVGSPLPSKPQAILDVLAAGKIRSSRRSPRGR